ncbi:MAG: Crp/Fnr family transcriptional regulator [Elusimicrobiota bacterium]|jgi:CRP/FNR family transcriptional regulator
MPAIDAGLLRALKAAPMFSAVGEEALSRLVGRCTLRRVEAGAAVFEAGTRADRFFAVLSGRVKVCKLSPRGDEQILHLYGPGRTIGEAAVWAQIDYPASAAAVEDALLLVIPYLSLRDAVSKDPDLVMGMLAGMSAKLHEFVRLIEELSLKEVPARLAGILLAESKRAGAPRFRLKQSKRELASQIGTIAETLSRALAKLKSAGLIDVRGSTFTLKDPAALRKLADYAAGSFRDAPRNRACT